MKSFITILEGHIKNFEKKESNTSWKTHNEFTDHYRFPMNTTHERTLNEYTRGSAETNEALWDQHKGGGHDPAMTKAKIDDDTPALDAALSKYKTPKAFKLHSGTPIDPREHKNAEGIVHHPAYLSGSLNHKVAKDFAVYNHGHKTESSYAPGGHPEVHHLEINVPKGHAGAYVDHISKYSGQREFILPRGLNLKHVKTTSKIVKKRSFEDHFNSFDGESDYKVNTHHMEIV